LPFAIANAGRGCRGAGNTPHALPSFTSTSIAINHFKDELYICENEIAGIGSELPLVNP